MGAARADGESSEQAEPASGEGAEGQAAEERADGQSDGDVGEGEDEGRRESTGSSRRRARVDPEPVERRGLRSLSRRAWAAIATVAGLVAGGASFVADSADVFDKFKGPPPLIEAASEAISECSRPGYVCEQALGDPIRFAPGAGQLIAIGVNLYKLEKIGGDDHKYIVGSGVVVFEDDEDRKVRWRSQIATITAGFGVTGLSTDNSNHLFASFAVTNHSGFVWAIDVSSTPVKFFGTDIGQPVIDGFSDDKNMPNGFRLLYRYREGWPASTQNPTTSRDVYEWTGNDYRFARCEVLSQEPYIATTAKVTDVRPPGTCAPITNRDVILDGSRPATAPAP